MEEKLIIGVGGCGVNSIVHLKKLGLKGKFMGISNAERISTHKDSSIEVIDIEDFNLNSLKQLKNISTVFIVNGIGGKTGTSLAPEIAKTLKSKFKVVSISTLPFTLERKRCEKVEEFLNQMKENSNEIIIRKNQELIKKYPDITLDEAFMQMDKELYDQIVLY